MKIVRGVTLDPQSLFTVKALINFQISYPHIIKLVNTKVMKISYKTKIRTVLLNVKMGSEISYDTDKKILRIPKRGGIVEKVYCFIYS